MVPADPHLVLRQQERWPDHGWRGQANRAASALKDGKVTASYTLTRKNAIGPARFRVVCGIDIDNARVGEASFRVQPSRSPVLVWVTPRAGGPGTVVRINAEVGQCRYHYAYFRDSKADGVTIAGGTKPIKPLHVTAAGRLTASYTITNKDATGPARFSVGCGYEDDTARFAEASFQVHARPGPGPGPRPGPGPGPGGGDGPLQVPNRVDTGLGPTDGGIDPVWLLLPAGLLLIALAAALRLRQAATRRR